MVDTDWDTMARGPLMPMPTTAMAATAMARGPLMLMPTTAMAAMDMAVLAMDTARGLLMPKLTMALMVLAMDMAVLATDMARGLLMLRHTMALAMAATATVDSTDGKRSADAEAYYGLGYGGYGYGGLYGYGKRSADAYYGGYGYGGLGYGYGAFGYGK